MSRVQLYCYVSTINNPSSIIDPSTIKCSKEVSEKDKNFLGVKTEQSFRNFPAGIDSTNISAEMVDGILKVTLPKREADKPKYIDIK